MILFTSVALAGGGGIYTQLGLGAAWSNTSGPLVRGDGTHLDIGGYFGPYQRSMRYGRYTRLGMRLNFGLHQPALRADSGTSTVSASVSVARGFDLMNIGYWAGINLGPAARLAFDLDDDTLEIKPGVAFRAEVGGLYNLVPALGFGLRLEMGVDFVPSVGTSVSGGLGITNLLRIPLVNPRRKERKQERRAKKALLIPAEEG